MKHENKKQICDQCDYKNISNYKIKQHREAKHLGIRYDCSTCDWSGPTLKNLRLHQTGNHSYSYACNKCNFQASNRNGLRRHTKKHAPREPVYCDQCDFKCVDKTWLKSHKESIHLGITFNFEHCGKGGLSTMSLLVHISSVHAELEKCDQCDFKSKVPRLLKSHKEFQHQGIAHECAECGKGGLTNEGLRSHK